VSERDGTLDPADLAIVLSHFNLGVIKAMTPITRGTPGTVKYEIDAERGRFILKRRREPRDQLDRVAFGHAVQIAITSAGFPAPKLVGTARHHSSMVIHAGALFEIHEWAVGSRYDDSVPKTMGAGAALARLHDTLARTPIAAPVPRFPTRAERRANVMRHLEDIRRAGHGFAATAERVFIDAGLAIDALGIDRWPEGTIHGDWHPGNLLFDADRVAAVLDFDNARPGHRILDLATGVLQFSLLAGTPDPKAWPDHADAPRVEAFLKGYDATASQRLSKAELDAIPPLMVEALVGEAVGPIATTGRFAAIEGQPFLEMVTRKANWVMGNAAPIRAAAR
jgi:homoserine kinase type II